MKHNIILIGPIGVGKSTIGKLLANALELSQTTIDAVRFDFYNEIGYDEKFAESLSINYGFWSKYLYWREFECYAVERLMDSTENSVIDFGAGHSVYENENHLNRVKKSLEGNLVILLLPSIDNDESYKILDKRLDIPQDKKDMNLHFLKNKSNKELANMTVYTMNKTPNETCEEIVSLLRNVKI